MLGCLRGFAQEGASNIEFVENKGQWDPRVIFRGQISIGTLFLEKGGFTALLYHPDDLERLSRMGRSGDGDGRRDGGSAAADYPAVACLPGEVPGSQ